MQILVRNTIQLVHYRCVIIVVVIGWFELGIGIRKKFTKCSCIQCRWDLLRVLHWNGIYYQQHINFVYGIKCVIVAFPLCHVIYFDWVIFYIFHLDARMYFHFPIFSLSSLLFYLKLSLYDSISFTLNCFFFCFLFRSNFYQVNLLVFYFISDDVEILIRNQCHLQVNVCLCVCM